MGRLIGEKQNGKILLKITILTDKSVFSDESRVEHDSILGITQNPDFDMVIYKYTVTNYH